MEEETMNEGTPVDIYEAVIADLESKIEAMRMTIDSLRSIRVIAGSSPKTNSQNQSVGSTSFTHDAFFGMTVADASKKCLAAMKKTATVGELTDALIAGGLKSSSKNMRENIRTIISRHPEFVRINGQFGLVEWYPGRKAQKREKPNSAFANSVKSDQDSIELDNHHSSTE